MKPIIKLSLSGILLSLLSISAHSDGSLASISTKLQAEFTKNIEPWLNTKNPYPWPERYAAAPARCDLVHINHLGRHGSRHISSEGDFLEDVMAESQKLGLITFSDDGIAVVSESTSLTLQGQALAKKVIDMQAMYLADKNQFGSITDFGAKELQRHGANLFRNVGLTSSEAYNLIQTRGLKAESTAVPRTQQSRSAFMQGLDKFLGNRNIDTFVKTITPKPNEIDRQLHFYDYCPAYADKKKQAKTAHKKLNNEAVFNKIHIQRAFSRLSDVFVPGLEPKAQKDFATLFHKLCQLDANEGYQLGICQMLLKQPGKTVALKAISKAADIKQFYKRGPAALYEGVNEFMTVDLINSWLETTGSAVQYNSGPIANLRFAHDSTILRLELMLGLINARSALDDEENITFNTAKLAPMSAQIVWQTYACPSNYDPRRPEYRVRMLVNDVVTPFPVKGCEQEDMCPMEQCS